MNDLWLKVHGHDNPLIQPEDAFPIKVYPMSLQTGKAPIGRSRFHEILPASDMDRLLERVDLSWAEDREDTPYRAPVKHSIFSASCRSG